MLPCRWCGDDLTLDCSSAILGLLLLLLPSGPNRIDKKKVVEQRCHATLKFGAIIHCDIHMFLQSLFAMVEQQL
jgi:hypothetical protein